MQKPIIVVPRLPAELFLGDRYRVVHSSEEHAAFIAEGWSPEREPERCYVVHTAVEQAPELEAPIDPELAAVRLAASAGEPLISIPVKVKPTKRLYPVKLAASERTAE